jgi:PilZ domain.
MDRRKAERRRLAPPVSSMIDNVPAVVVDLSSTGCQVEHDRAIAEGAVQLSMFCDRAPIVISATIVRAEPRLVGGLPYGYLSGLAFEEVDELATLSLAAIFRSAAGVAVQHA